VNLWEWWGFSSSGIRVGNNLCKEKENLQPCRQEDVERDQWSMQLWEKK
jgi:hypothetical protein